MMATIEHFELIANDVERAKAFYAKLFGWEFAEHGEGTGYWMISTKGLKGEKGLGGGLMKRMDEKQESMNYITVEDIDAALKAVEEAGGKILAPRKDLENVGATAAIADPEGNVLGLWQHLKQE